MGKIVISAINAIMGNPSEQYVPKAANIDMSCIVKVTDIVEIKIFNAQ